MSDTPRTERLIAFMEREKRDIWQALKTLTDWARGLESECALMRSALLKLHESKAMNAWAHSVVRDAIKNAAPDAECPSGREVPSAAPVAALYGPSTGESPLGSKKPVPVARGMAHQLTAAEKRALREAATFRLSGEMEEERYRKALETALEKL